jgi:hypothetical protein
MSSPVFAYYMTMMMTCDCILLDGDNDKDNEKVSMTTLPTDNIAISYMPLHLSIILVENIEPLLY